MKLKYEISSNRAGSDPDKSVGDLNSYQTELDNLLRLVESSQTYYQLLSLDRSATQQQVRHAYQQSLSLLFPPYHLSSEISRGTLVRMERAFEKTSRAFSVLALSQKRREYDAALFGGSNWLDNQLADERPLPMPQPAKPTEPPPVKVTAATIVPPPQVVLPSVETSNPKILDKGINRRRAVRIRMPLSVRVTGHDRRNGKWDEMAETIDVSRTGITIRSRRKMRHGAILFLSLPMPEKLRSHGFGAPSYNIYAMVRRVERAKGGARTVGLEFLGEHPPKGYLETPWALYRTTAWSGMDRRRKKREISEEMLSIEFFDESAQSIGTCMAKTENISQSGVRICVRQVPTEFELVRVTFTGRGFQCFATLQNRYLGNDGFERLCLAFLGSELPE